MFVRSAKMEVVTFRFGVMVLPEVGCGKVKVNRPPSRITKETKNNGRQQ